MELGHSESCMAPRLNLQGHFENREGKATRLCAGSGDHEYLHHQGWVSVYAQSRNIYGF